MPHLEASSGTPRYIGPAPADSAVSAGLDPRAPDHAVALDHAGPGPHDPETFAETVLALRAAGCVFAEEEALLLMQHAASPCDLAESVERRVAGSPLEYILRWVGFAGERIGIGPGVFVPRRRTELLVQLAAQLLSAGDTIASTAAGGSAPGTSGPRASTPEMGADPAASTGGVFTGDIVVDLCCGSGAVAVVLARRLPGIEIHAADIDPTAVRCARRNLSSLGAHVHEGDLFRALPPDLKGQIRVLTVNAPYVPTEAIRTMPPEARLHEPLASLDGGTDGLDVHRRIAAEAGEWIAPGGWVLIETSERQASGTAALLAGAGLAVQTVHDGDLDGTVVLGRRTG